MKKLNTIKASILSTAIISLASCGTAEDRMESYIEKGQEYFQAGSLDKARVEFKNALQINPKSAEAHYYMASVHEKKQEFGKAVGGYTKTIELMPEHKEALSGIGRIYLIAGNPDKALEYAEQVLNKDNKFNDALAVKAGALYKKGNQPTALATVRDSLTINPDHISSLALLARIYMVDQQASKAESLLTSAANRNPENKSLTFLLVKFYADNKLFDKAAAQMSVLIKSEPENLQYKNQLAFYLDKQGKLDEAETVLRNTVTELPDNLQAKIGLIRFLAERRDLMMAQVELSRFLNEDENNPDLNLVAANLYIKTKDYDKAESIFRAIKQQYEKEAQGINAQYELTRLLVSQQRMEDGITELESLLKNQPKHAGGLMMRGILALKERNTKTAINDFRAILNDQPTSIETMKLLSEAYITAGDVELAHEQLVQLLRVDPADINARLVFAKLLHQKRDYTSAIKELEIISKVQPENVEARQVLFKSYLAANNLDSADKIAIELQQQYPDQASGFYFQGLVYQAKKDSQQAMNLYDQAMKINPDAIELLSSYVRAAMHTNQHSLAIKKLQSVVKNKPEHVIAYNLLGEVQLERKQVKNAIQTFEKAIALNAEWWIPYRNLASAQIQLEQYDAAVKTYREGIAKATQAEKLYLQLALLLESRDQITEAIALYDDMLAKQPESDLAANNLALLLVSHKQDKPSQERALKLVNKFQVSRNPVYLDTLGWVHFKRGENEKALAALLQADELAPNQALIHYHLGSVYFSRGNKEQARKFLQNAVNSKIAAKEMQDAQRILKEIEKV